MIQDAANSRAQDKMARIETFLGQLGERLIQLMQQYMTGEQVVRVVGPTAMPMWLTYDKDYIKGEFDFEVEAGSTQPQNETFRRQSAMQLVDAMAPFAAGRGDQRPRVGQVRAADRLRGQGPRRRSSTPSGHHPDPSRRAGGSSRPAVARWAPGQLRAARWSAARAAVRPARGRPVDRRRRRCPAGPVAGARRDLPPEMLQQLQQCSCSSSRPKQQQQLVAAAGDDATRAAARRSSQQVLGQFAADAGRRPARRGQPPPIVESAGSGRM